MDALVKKQLTPGYKPDINEGELKYFDQRLVKDDQLDFSVVPQEAMKLINKNKNLFEKF
jgi:hypothetical protein